MLGTKTICMACSLLATVQHIRISGRSGSYCGRCVGSAFVSLLAGSSLLPFRLSELTSPGARCMRIFPCNTGCLVNGSRGTEYFTVTSVVCNVAYW